MFTWNPFVWNRRRFVSSVTIPLALGMASARPQATGTSPELETRLSPPVGKVDAVVDSDTYNEIDDQFAVSYALLSPDKLTIHAVYAAPFHNERSDSAEDGMEKSYQEILRILRRLGKETEGFAFRGSKSFMQEPGKRVDSPAARDLIKKAMAPRSGPLYVITIGAPTNVSSAILMEPAIKQKIVVVWLGGQPLDLGTAREFNLQQDIHSSRVLFDSGVPLVVVPTRNVSEHLRTTVPEIQHYLKGKSPIADYLASEYEAYTKWKSPSPDFPLTRVIWDISAVAWLVEPKWIPTKIVPSPYLEDGFTYRQSPDRHPIRYATHVNRDRVFDDLFRKLANAK